MGINTERRGVGPRYRPARERTGNEQGGTEGPHNEKACSAFHVIGHSLLEAENVHSREVISHSLRVFKFAQ